MPLPITLTVHNTTGRVVRGRIAVRGLSDGWSDLATPPLTLLPDATMRTTLMVRPAASLTPGRYPLTVTVVAEDNRTIYATTTVDLRVMATLPLLPRQTLLWLAAVPVILALLLLAGLQVFAGGSGRSAAAPTVAPTVSMPVGRPTRSSGVIGRAPVAPGVTPTPTVRSAPTLPTTLVAPRIEHFTVARRWRDAPYAVVWQTSNATTVTLNGTTVAPDGQLALEAPIKGATYRLVAVTGAKQAAGQLRIAVDSSGVDGYAGSSIRLSLPRVMAFALQPRGDALYAVWRVSDATRVRLQGQPVYESGMRIVLPGVTTVTLSAGNAVGTARRVRRVRRVPQAPIAAPLPAPIPEGMTVTSSSTPESAPQPAVTP